MNHTHESKRVKFTPYTVEIVEISTNKVVELGFADHQVRMYKFSHFLPYSRGNVLLTHANDTSKLWHERYGHINNKYLQALSKEGMVEGIPSIKISNGTCIGCVVGKDPKCNYENGKVRRHTQLLDLVNTYIIGPLP